jgi:hypothetical protein
MRNARILTFVTVVLAAGAGIAVPAHAVVAEVPREVTTEFRQHVVKRDKLIRELHSLDQKAADAVIAGGAPNATHARQIELQDQVDLIQLRLETMAVRWNLEVPPAPVPGKDQMNEAEIVAARVEGAFITGRERTDRALQERCRQMIASINVDAFLARAD